MPGSRDFVGLVGAWPIANKRHNINHDEPEPPLENSSNCPIHSDDGHVQDAEDGPGRTEARIA